MCSCPPNLFTNRGESGLCLEKSGVQVLLCLVWKHWWVQSRRRSGGGGGAGGGGSGEENVQTLKNVWRTLLFFLDRETESKRLPGTPGAYTVQLVWERRSGSANKLFAVWAYKAIPPYIPGEGAQKEMNLRYQFAEFCSIDCMEPGDLALDGGSLAGKQNYLRMGKYALCPHPCLKETSALSLLGPTWIPCECSLISSSSLVWILSSVKTYFYKS